MLLHQQVVSTGPPIVSACTNGAPDLTDPLCFPLGEEKGKILDDNIMIYENLLKISGFTIMLYFSYMIIQSYIVAYPTMLEILKERAQ